MYIETGIDAGRAGQKADREQFWKMYLGKLDQANDLGRILLLQTGDQAAPDRVSLEVGLDATPLQALSMPSTLWVLAAWLKVLSVYSREQQTIAGLLLPSLGTSLRNGRPLAVRWDSNATLRSILQNLSRDTQLIEDHQNPQLDPQAQKSLFQSIVVEESGPSSWASDRKLPLIVGVQDQDGALTIRLHFIPDQVRTSDANAMLQLLLILLRQMPSLLDQDHRALSLISEDERQRLESWSEVSNPYPRDQSIGALFEATTQRFPDRIAVTDGKSSLSYAELKSLTDRVALNIRQSFRTATSQDMTETSVVAVFMDRGFDAIVSMLAILKAGAAYAPIDPVYPQDRIRYMLEKTDARLMVTNRNMPVGLALPKTVQLLNIQELMQDTNDLNQTLPSSPDTQNAAYVMFTSGSTGRPKAITIPHRAVVRLIRDTNYVRLDEHQNMLQIASIAFDAATFEIWGALLNGGKLVLAPAGKPDLKDLSQLIQSQKVSCTFLTTSLYNAWIDQMPQGLLGIDQILVGGEALSPIHAEKALTELPGTLLINAYGPTENTTFTTHYTLREKQSGGSIPIGTPIANSSVYILNQDLSLVPIGVIGELCTGGDGLALGYRGDSELTAEKFVERTLFDRPVRFYRTGDLARWRADGTIEYMGRIDHQVKIRGFRIEPGEIEHAMTRIPGVLQAHVLAKVVESTQGRQTTLIAYYVADNDLSEDILTAHLAQSLPDYMIPKFFIALPEIPLTANGKVNRQYLPEPELQQLSNDLHQPRDERDAQLCQIWGSILGLERVNIRDNFFSLGGNSILAIRACHRMTEALGVRISVADLYKHKNIETIADHVSNQQVSRILPSTRVKPLLSFAQERLWFIQQMERGSAYNIPMVLELHAATEIKPFVQALRALVERHSALRTVFGTDSEGQFYQKELKSPSFVTEGVITRKELQGAFEKLSESVFDLQREVPIKAYVYRVEDHADDQEYAPAYAMLNIHHVAFDGWSADIFSQELLALYEHFALKKTLKLPALKIQYKDFAEWQRQYLKGDVLNRLIHYWHQNLRGMQTLQLPTDRPRPAKYDFRGDSIAFALSNDLSDRLRAEALRLGTTLYTLLLSGFYVLISKRSGQNDLLVGTPMANRDHEDLQNVIGFFVNSLVLRLQLNPDLSVAELWSHVHKVVQDAKAHQELPFDRIVDLLKVKPDASRHPIFQILFTVQTFGATDEVHNPYFSMVDLSDQVTTAKFDLSLMMDDSQPMIRGILNFAKSLFDKETLQVMADQYCSLLEDMLTKRDEAVGALNLQTRTVVSQAESDLFWNSYLPTLEQAGDLSRLLLPIPSDEKAPARTSIEVALTDTSRKDLLDAAAAENIPLTLWVQAAWQKVLSVHSRESNTIAGLLLPSLGTALTDSRPLAISWDRTSTLGDVLRTLAAASEAIEKHQDVKRDIHAARPLFRSIVALEAEATDWASDHRWPLVIGVQETAETLKLRLHFLAGQITDTLAVALLQQLHEILSQLPGCWNHNHTSLSLLNDSEQSRLKTWSEVIQSYPQDQSIDELFEETAQRFGDRIALTDGSRLMSYKELKDLSDHLANQLSPHQGSVVALFMDRGFEAIISMLAILKAGAAYAPIDPAYPQDRIGYMLEKANTRLLLTNQGMSGLSLPASVAVLDYKKAMDNKNVPAQKSTHTPLAPAYVMFTSGSTGRPKAIEIPHRGVVRLVRETNYVQLDEHQVILQLASIAFDAATFEIWGALLNGGKLVIAPPGKPDLKNLSELIQSQKVSCTFITTSLFNAWIDQLPQGLKGVSQILIGGEALSVTHVRKALRELPGTRLANGYGPTENTTFTTAFPISEANGDSIPIGTPIANTSVYILDQNLVPVPVGTVGELCAAGDGLALRYLGDSELTQEKFVEKDIFGRCVRLYRTGDLACWREDGTIEYLGRMDFQLKIRGFRIEPGEIEHALTRIPGILQAHVQAHHSALVGYYVADGELSQEILMAYLSQFLPDYMIPKYLIALKELPLTPNGKVDKRLLPEPQMKGTDANGRAPRNEMEEIACHLWKAVLDREQLTIDDDFFQCGGNSILAMRVAHQMSVRLGMHIPVADIFAHSTIAALLQSATGLKQISIMLSDERRPPLSFAQERLLFMQQFEPDSCAYNVPLAFELSTAAEPLLIQQAIQAIVDRHAVLRTVFKEGPGGLVYQEIQPIERFVITSASISEAEWETRVAEHIQQPFRLQEELPIKVWMYQVQNVVRVLINIHHVAFDGWSTDVFIKELAACYEAQATGGFLALDPLEIQYKDYAVWQRQYLSGDELGRHLEYWKGKLQGFETLELPTDRPRPARPTYLGDTVSFAMDQQLSGDLRNLARTLGISLYSVLLGSFSLLLSRYSGQQDVLIGSPVANRDYHQLQHLIGFFVNSIPLRLAIQDTMNVQEFLKQVHQTVVEAQAHQELPFEKLVDELQPERDLSRHPLFQVSFAVQSFGQQDGQSQDGDLLQFIDLSNALTTEKFDLSLMIDDSQDCLEGTFSFATSLFDKATIAAMTRRYQTVLWQFLDATSLGTIQLLSPIESQSLIESMQKIPFTYESEQSFHGLFQKKVAETPDAIALSCEADTLTYAELNARANALARYIQGASQQAPGSQTIIAIFMERSIEMVVSILAVMKSGAAYVPIDPRFPKDRVDFILKDTAAALILTHEKCRHDLQGIVNIKRQIFVDARPESGEATTNLSTVVQPQDLIYVLYTSGTTGNPKGVLIEHRNLVHYFMAAGPGLYEGLSRSIACNTYTFDASINTLYGPLLFGKQVIIVPNGGDELEKVAQLVASPEPTYIGGTPSYLEALLEYEVGPRPLSGRHRVVFGGEVLKVDLWKRWQELLPQGSFVNHYGPTETTITSTELRLSHGTSHEAWEACSIGQGVGQTWLYVLDSQMNVVPPGVYGELYIGGHGVGRGYLNRPELTRERFLVNPFVEAKSHGLLYRTGDLVRWLPNGELQYKGRNDLQVKINGLRIELGEIETALQGHPQIQQACVLVKERLVGERVLKFLAAYYVAAESLPTSSLEEHLTRILPEYLVPKHYVRLNAFPLNASGKLDRKALPEPEITVEHSEPVAPRDELELKLCCILREVLGVPSLGIRDDFFAIGGDSIKAMLLHSRLKQESIQLSLREIFGLRNVEVMAAFIRNEKRNAPADRANDAEWQLIENLNPVHPERPTLWMVHPSLSGAEVYHGLAQRLTGRWNCIGIHNYNYASKTKIDRLNDLAEVYLEQMGRSGELDGSGIHLLGWSFGGMIALQMAAVLEQMGHRNVHVYLLDTFMLDQTYMKLIACQNLGIREQSHRKLLSDLGLSSDHIDRVISTMGPEESMMKSAMIDQLIHTRVILFKAQQTAIAETPEQTDLLKQLAQSSANNLDGLVDRLDVRAIDCTHQNILSQGLESLVSQLSNL